MRDTLTARQKEILNFIIEYINREEYPPSVRDIKDKFGFSTNAAHQYTRILIKKKYIEVDPKKSRAIRVLRFPEGHRAEVRVCRFDFD